MSLRERQREREMDSFSSVFFFFFWVDGEKSGMNKQHNILHFCDQVICESSPLALAERKRDIGLISLEVSVRHGNTQFQIRVHRERFCVGLGGEELFDYSLVMLDMEALYPSFTLQTCSPLCYTKDAVIFIVLSVFVGYAANLPPPSFVI